MHWHYKENWVLYKQGTKTYEVFIRNGACTKSKFVQKSIAMCRDILWIAMGFFVNEIKKFYYNKLVLLYYLWYLVVICREIIKERFELYMTSSASPICKIFAWNWRWYVIMMRNFTFNHLFYKRGSRYKCIVQKNI